MFETNVTIVGNVLNPPETRRTSLSQQMVTSFRIASTTRRYDKTTESWVDGDSLRVRVTCWRRLAEHVQLSVRQGDPLVVTGRLFTREFTTDSGERRTMYELEAAAVGHDLARGTSRFARWRPTATDMIDDGTDEVYAGGEATEAVAGDLEEEGEVGEGDVVKEFPVLAYAGA
ncbi:single-stranded DNA-binding protein [Longispora albida]|uniref:single-stranded DNA-binding protein n=1 Tax=Longispora albida TaxID=203523 RepID=UPI00037B55CF|nr:single-stranded DNA-binding protein [Longispora albida]